MHGSKSAAVIAIVLLTASTPQHELANGADGAALATMPSSDKAPANSVAGLPRLTPRRRLSGVAADAVPRDSCTDLWKLVPELRSELKRIPGQQADSVFRVRQQQDSAVREIKKAGSSTQVDAAKHRYENRLQEIADSARIRTDDVKRQIGAAEASFRRLKCKAPKGT